MGGYEVPVLTVLNDLLKDGAGTALTEITAEGSESWSYSKLKAEVERMQKSMVEAGLSNGDVVSLILVNSLEFVAVFLATTALGAVVAPLNATYTEEEFSFYLEDAGARVVVVTPSGFPENAVRAAKGLGKPIWRVGRENSSVTFASDPEVPIASSDTTGSSPETTCLFLHTSGTTSRPKGVPLTHKNLCASIMNICTVYELAASDVTELVMPLFHVHGLMGCLLSTLASGGEVIIPTGGKFSASNFWPVANARNMTWYTAVPTIHQILLARYTDEQTIPNLRFIRSCSASLAPAVLEDLEKKFGAKVLEAYAMTEASHMMTSNPLKGERRPGSVGVGGKNVEVGILSDDDELVPVGAIGEVCVRGANVTKGYLNNPEANKVAYAGGWFHTGDQGMLSEDGYLTLTGRIKELINRGGEKISPLEVDAALLAHEAVAEAISFAAPDEKYGEEVNAAIVLKPGAEQPSQEAFKEFCAGRLATFKIPKKFFFDTSLPKTATGKIQRRFVAAHFLK
ncbi:hypothetical protein NDN08_000155 [Rhodosorus marinus]|uniref:Uncharacterized protein n=1 Tax=Rhodosorus marinus TaxID=101924 RepID=A0AAV8UHB2_9RHOD|nr:hypothetical protein NDN08_000155 [Rhodosorus marinus]